MQQYLRRDTGDMPDDLAPPPAPRRTVIALTPQSV
jgi:hypothetical protein